MVPMDASGRAMCTECGAWRNVALFTLQAAIEPAACLWDKLAKCRFLRGCKCANRFFYLQGGRFVGML